MYLKLRASIHPVVVNLGLHFQRIFSVRLVRAEAEHGGLPARSTAGAWRSDVIRVCATSHRVAAAAATAIFRPATAPFTRPGAALLLLFSKFLQFLHINRTSVFCYRSWSEAKAL